MLRSLVVLVACALPAWAAAQDAYPTKAINITVPNPPGGMNQIHATPLSTVLEKLTGQPAPVVNRSGGTAAVGTAYVANQPGDGHNILVTTPNIYLALEKDKLYGIKSPYSLDQLALIALLSADPLIMTLHPSMPAKTVKEFTALAKARPNEIVFSTSGPYSITHAPVALYMHAAGVKMRHLPTTGGGPAITQLLGGHSQVTAGGLAAVYQYVKSGQLRAIASWGAKPSASLPNVPTMISLGYDQEAYLWVGLFTSAATPPALLGRVRELIGKAAADPAFRQALEKAQVVPDYRDAPEFRKFFDADYKRMALAVKLIGKT